MRSGGQPWPYDSIAGVYLKALTLMKKENILDKYKIRAEKVVHDTRNIGWGFHDYLGQVYRDFYGE